MMSQQSKKSTKRPIILWVTLGVILVVVILASLIIRHRLATTNPPDQPTTAQKKQAAAQDLAAKKAVIEGSTDASKTTSTTPSTSTTAADQQIDLSAKTESNDSVTVIAKLTGIASGTCSLSITNGGQSYSNKADVIYQPEYSSCAGFSVPVSGLGKGTWSITLVVTANGSDTSKTISYEVK